MSPGYNQGLGELAADQTWTGANTFLNATFASKGPRPWFDVTAYGADPTGGADSYPTIQAALTAGAGGVVLFPPGLYSLSTYVTASANTTIVGWGATLQARAGNSTSICLYLPVSGCTVQGLTFDGNKANQTAGTPGNGLLEFVTGNGCRVLDCKFINTWGCGVFVWQGSDHIVENCYFDACGKTNVSDGTCVAIKIDGGVSNARIANNRVSGSSGCGIYLGTNSSNVVIANNTVVNSYFLGIALGATANGVTVTGNTVIQSATSTSNCIDIGNSTDATVVGNYCYGADRTGVSGVANAPPSYRSVIASNVIEHCDAGIGVGGNLNIASDLQVTGNTIRFCRSNGISFPYAVDSVVSNNIVMDCGQNTALTADNRSGILLFGSAVNGWVTNVVVSGNRCGDDQASKTQTYGIYVEGASNTGLLIVGNNLVGNLTGALLPVSGSGTHGGNQGYDVPGSFASF